MNLGSPCRDHNRWHLDRVSNNGNDQKWMHLRAFFWRRKQHIIEGRKKKGLVMMPRVLVQWVDGDAIFKERKYFRAELVGTAAEFNTRCRKLSLSPTIFPNLIPSWGPFYLNISCPCPLVLTMGFLRELLLGTLKFYRSMCIQMNTCAGDPGLNYILEQCVAHRLCRTVS